MTQHRSLHRAAFGLVAVLLGSMPEADAKPCIAFVNVYLHRSDGTMLTLPHFPYPIGTIYLSIGDTVVCESYLYHCFTTSIDSLRILHDNDPPVTQPCVSGTTVLFTAPGQYQVSHTALFDVSYGAYFTITTNYAYSVTEEFSGEQQFQAHYENGLLRLFGEPPTGAIRSITECTGRNVIPSKQIGAGERTINVGTLASGIYIVRLNDYKRRWTARFFVD